MQINNKKFLFVYHFDSYFFHPMVWKNQKGFILQLLKLSSFFTRHIERAISSKIYLFSLLVMPLVIHEDFLCNICVIIGTYTVTQFFQ